MHHVSSKALTHCIDKPFVQAVTEDKFIQGIHYILFIYPVVSYVAQSSSPEAEGWTEEVAGRKFQQQCRKTSRSIAK
jgi:hypothetical protein